MIIFTLEQALLITDHYQYLVGELLDDSLVQSKISHISIAPSNNVEFSKFLGLYAGDENPLLALSQVVIEPSEVRILLLYLDKWNGNLLYSDIDSYLKRREIERIYISPKS